jgi:hypothetical protein
MERVRGGVNEGRGKTKIQFGLTKRKTEKSFSANLVSFRRLSSPPKDEITKIRRHQIDGDPDYKCCSHPSFLMISEKCKNNAYSPLGFVPKTLLLSLSLYAHLQKKFAALGNNFW